VIKSHIAILEGGLLEYSHSKEQNKGMSSKSIAIDILSQAGIPLNSSEPWSIHIHNERFWDRVISQKQLGLAESYMDGWWDCEAIDVMLTKLLTINVLDILKPSPALAFHVAQSILRNNQTKKRAASNAKHHYNIGNDLYIRMLDKNMAYSCGYWAKAKTLDEAQEAKFDLIARKLQLEPGMRLLDIGSGWGGFLRYVTKKYKLSAVGISPADNQIELARANSQGYDIEFIQQDYRDLTGTFDRITSIGMMEHVGPKNYSAFFAKCDELLSPDGMMLHHTIASNVTKQVTDPFFDRYIFPGGVLPSLAQIARASEKKFIIEDVHNFGPDYDKTLMHWYVNINNVWDEIPQYDERFRRMWNYYLLASAAGFRSGDLQLLQNVFHRKGVRETYVTAR
jgi:cyclopropane-fatty-acyl-phospholipid synthase